MPVALLTDTDSFHRRDSVEGRQSTRGQRGALDLRNVIQMSNVSNPTRFVRGATIKCLAHHPSDKSIFDFQCRCSLTVAFLHVTSAGKIATNDLPHQVRAMMG